jgi:ABC-2 type transport system permease protein
MFTELFLFEIKYRLRHISTYVYFAIWFFMTLFAVSAEGFGPIGAGKIFRNGPFALYQYCGQLTGFGIIIISAIFGTSILRDFSATPISSFSPSPFRSWLIWEDVGLALLWLRS